MLKNMQQYNENLNEAVALCFKSCFEKHAPESKNKPFVDILSSLKDENFVHHLPYKVFFKITSECNLRCKHCFYYDYQYRFNSQNDLPIEDLLTLSKFFVEDLNVISFTLTGGEPFLNKNIFDLIKYLKSKNIYLNIITNATLITKEIAEELGKLLDPTMDFIRVSIDGIHPETHDKIRGKGSFEKTKTAIANLKSNNVNVVVVYTPTSLNIDELPELYDFCKSLNIEQAEINRYKIPSESQKDLYPTIDKLFFNTAELIQNIGKDSFYKLRMMHINHFDFLQTAYGKKLLDNYLETKSTPAPKELMCHRHGKIMVSAQGKIYLCAETETDELCLGDLKEKNFFDLWDQRFNNIFFKKRLTNDSLCKACKYLKICHSGCPASAYEKYGNINAPDAKCPIGEQMMKNDKGTNNVK